MIWTPRDIAEWCNKLCDLKLAKKQFGSQYPERFTKEPDQYFPRLVLSQLKWMALGLR